MALIPRPPCNGRIGEEEDNKERFIKYLVNPNKSVFPLEKRSRGVYMYT